MSVKTPGAGALLLTPGAGGGRDHHTLVAIEHAVLPVPCERVEFPYQLAGRRMPDKPDTAITYLREVAADLTARVGIAPGRLALGGRSYGGRMCSMAVADGLPSAGLILLSYPLHPPGKPERLRVEHFPRITVPVLLVSGRSDPFGSPEEFDREVTAISGPVTQVWLPGGHQPSSPDSRMGQIVRDWCEQL